MTMNLSPETIEAARNVRLLLLDCDGVLTDGRLYFSASGEELKVFDVQDGHGIVNWIRAGYRVGIISGRNSRIVQQRADELGIDLVFQGVKNKLEIAHKIFSETGITAEETVFVGDDTADIELMQNVALAVAVANAVDSVKAAANHVTVSTGGRGAVREVIDLLHAQKSLEGSLGNAQ